MQKRKRIRLSGFNYAGPGAYFITTVVNDRQCIFGDIGNGTIQLSQYGEILIDQWHWLEQQYSYIALDEFVVMPNHFHGILNITDDFVGAGRDRPLQQTIKPVSQLIGVFKTTTSKRIHQLGMTWFQWQRSFYDRIIRNDKELNRIREYIRTNPLRWDLDIENESDTDRADSNDLSLRNQTVQNYYDKIFILA